VPFNQPGCRANALLSGSFVTSATLEVVPAAAEPSAAAAPAGEGVPA